MNDRLSYDELEKRLKELELEVFHAREALRESGERHKALFDGMADGVYRSTRDGRFVDINQSMVDMFGYASKEEMLRADIIHELYFSPEDRESEAREAGLEQKEIYRMRRRDGSEIWVEDHGRYVYDDQGRIVFHEGILRDVTERINAEEILRNSEEQYRNILENMEEAYYEVDLKGSFTFLNSSVVSNLGYTNEEMKGMNFQQYVDKGNAQKVFDAYHRVFLTGEPIKGFDWEIINKKGEKISVEASVALKRDAQGKPIGFRGVVRDITKRKQAEEALRESEEKYRTILESIEEAYSEIDLEGNFTFMNESLCRILGYSRDELVGMNNRDYTTPEMAKRAFRMFNEIYRTGKATTMLDYEIIRKDGTRRFVDLSVSLKRDRCGNATGFRCVGRDVTEKVKTEQALRESEKRYRMLAENVYDAVWTADLDLKFTSVSPSIVRLCGFTSEEMMGKSIRHYFTQASLVMAETVLAEELENEKDDRPFDPNRSRTIELEMLHKDGRTIWIENMATFKRDDENRPIEILGVTRDITERKNAAEALKQSEERFRDLAELLPETIFETDLAGRLTFVNQNAFEQFGYGAEDLMGELSVMDMIVPEDRDFGRRNMQRVLSGENVGLKEYTARRKNGSTFPVMVHSAPIIRDGRPMGLRGFLIDISEKKNLEEQLMRAQKMEAIGTLAGGIAHDFNNLLMGILGNVSLMMIKMDETHPFHDRMKSIEEYVQRGSDLTKQLLGFARGGKYEVKPTHLGEFIQRSSEMFGRTKKEIRIHRKAQDALWSVEVDRGQMEQVLLNLFVNAWQAMPGGGDLYLSTENIELSEADVDLYELKPGRYVKISVTDTGTGMDEATMARIFEPFFTTKERGRGTGLGLASVYGIIKNHGGFIRVESEKGVGSTFMIYLPASDMAVEGEMKPEERASEGRETILLIDDEEMILDVGSQMLSSLGYSVLSARGGSAGIDAYRENRENIDLVILDVIMPDLGGDVTFERLRNIDQTVNVLLSSGYSLDGQAKEIMEKGCKGFIQKPFSMEDLSRKIRGILDQQSAGNC